MLNRLFYLALTLYVIAMTPMLYFVNWTDKRRGQ
jgi:hypothetical protein